MKGYMTGTVKTFDDAKGFGFITVDGDDGDAFAHYKNIVGTGRRSLKTGQRVEFDVEETAKGLLAKNITVVVDVADRRQTERAHA